MLWPNTFSMEDARHDVMTNMSDIKKYLESKDFSQSSNEELAKCELYVHSLAELDKVVSLAKMQVDSLMAMAKQKRMMYEESLNKARRFATLTIKKGKGYRNYGDAVRLDFELVIVTEDNIEFGRFNDYLWWDERGRKNDYIERFEDICIKHNVTLNDLEISDLTKNKKSA